MLMVMNQPSNQLVVYNDDSSPDAGITIVGGATTAFGKIHFADGVAGSQEDVGRIIYDHNTNELQLWTNNSQTMTIDNDGGGIGITNPTKKLEIVASNTGGGENNTLRFVDTDVTSPADQQAGRIENSSRVIPLNLEFMHIFLVLLVILTVMVI